MGISGDILSNAARQLLVETLVRRKNARITIATHGFLYPVAAAFRMLNATCWFSMLHHPTTCTVVLEAVLHEVLQLNVDPADHATCWLRVLKGTLLEVNLHGCLDQGVGMVPRMKGNIFNRFP